MNNPDLARLARKTGCMGCCFFRQWPASIDGEVRGTCQVGAPRTSSTIKWPQVHATEWCGCFIPVEAQR